MDEKERFRLLAKEQLPRLYGIARRLVGDDAEDAVQDCLLKAFKAYGQLEDPSAAGAWMISILVNVCRDRGRSDARHVPEVSLDSIEEFSLFRQIADEDPFPYSDSLHLDFLGRFGPSDVHDVLAAMPLIYREPLVLVHMYGYSTKETARTLQAPLGTVLARLHRGRKMFEKRLWDHAENSGMLEEATK